MTEFRSMDCVGRNDGNDFQDYSHKTTPRDPYVSFPMCQLDARERAEAFRAPRRWEVPEGLCGVVSISVWHLILQGLSMWTGCGGQISYRWWPDFSKASVPRNQKGSCKGSSDLVPEITAPSHPILMVMSKSLN